MRKKLTRTKRTRPERVFCVECDRAEEAELRRVVALGEVSRRSIVPNISSVPSLILWRKTGSWNVLVRGDPVSAVDKETTIEM